MIYLIDLEYVETRYTAQWKTELPQSIADETGDSVMLLEMTLLELKKKISFCFLTGMHLKNNLISLKT